MLIPLDQATLARCGGKADGLRRLIEAGLPVPPGACLPLEIFRQALPPELPRDTGQAPADIESTCRPVRAALARWSPGPPLEAALGQLAARLGWPLVVRSSATCEDGEIAAPGLFETVLGVEDHAQLVEAIRRCWTSLWTVAAWLVLRRYGRSPGGEAMGLVLQRQVVARCAGLARSGDPLLVEAVEGAGERLAGGAADPASVSLPRAGEPLAGSLPLSPDELDALRAAVLTAEEIEGGTVEVEWAVDSRASRLWLLQTRRVRGPVSGGEVGVDPPPGWRWDREHNPEPLSPAHASLIERLDPGSERVRVIEGYLFEATGGPDTLSGDPLEAVWQRAQRDLVPRLDALERGAPALRTALGLFARVHRVYFGELRAARRRARRALVVALEEQGVADAEQLAAEMVSRSVEHETLERTLELHRLATAAQSDAGLRRFLAQEDAAIDTCPSASFRAALERHLSRYGALFSAWDVAAPTLGERPELLLLRLRAPVDGILLRRLGAGPHANEPSVAPDLLAGARLARRLEEDDDLLFARALRAVRRGLVQVGRELVDAGNLRRRDDVFLLTLSEALGEAALPGAEILERRRQSWALQRDRPPQAARGGGDALLRGLGVGGEARGEVRLVRRPDEILERDLRGGVVVCPTLLPALAVVLPEIAALVTDHGGLLSHAASLARELGVVAVVGTGRATRALREGQRVWVDGRQGLVVAE